MEKVTIYKVEPDLTGNTEKSMLEKLFIIFKQNSLLQANSSCIVKGNTMEVLFNKEVDLKKTEGEFNFNFREMNISYRIKIRK